MSALPNVLAVRRGARTVTALLVALVLVAASAVVRPGGDSGDLCGVSRGVSWEPGRSRMWPWTSPRTMCSPPITTTARVDSQWHHGHIGCGGGKPPRGRAKSEHRHGVHSEPGALRVPFRFGDSRWRCHRHGGRGHEPRRHCGGPVRWHYLRRQLRWQFHHDDRPRDPRHLDAPGSRAIPSSIAVDSATHTVYVGTCSTARQSFAGAPLS